jgi:glycosyltransferase involved in cell wall biosynthesis
MKKPVVAILMSSYNGARFIQEQIDSILNQKEVDVHFYISDDGSSDSTLDIINEYFKNYPDQFKKLFQGQFKNPARNFLSIFPKITQDYDYYAFSDQDDVWMEDKLQTAIKKINEGCALYCGRTDNTNNNLQSHSYSPLFSFPPSFKNAIVQSIAGGNTMVFNQEVFNLLKDSFNCEVPMHDWWTYLLTTFAGHQVYYDPIPKVFYRQHSNNFNGSQPLIELYNLARELFGNIIGSKNWIDIEFKNYEN